MKYIDTLVIGGGQAGLATSYYLTQAGVEHLILEKERTGKAWREERWDSFTLVTSNWTLRLPGLEHEGDNPEGFLTREEMVGYLERFAVGLDRHGLVKSHRSLKGRRDPIETYTITIGDQRESTEIKTKA